MKWQSVGQSALNRRQKMIDENSTKEDVLEAVKQKQDGFYLQYASEALKGDRDVVMEAVKYDGCSLQYASEELRGDKEVLLKAAKNDWEALQYASEDLRNDREVVFAVVYWNYEALRYAGNDLLYEVACDWQDAIKKGVFN